MCSFRHINDHCLGMSIEINPLSTKPTKWSNTLKSFNQNFEFMFLEQKSIMQVLTKQC